LAKWGFYTTAVGRRGFPHICWEAFSPGGRNTRARGWRWWRGTPGSGDSHVLMGSGCGGHRSLPPREGGNFPSTCSHLCACTRHCGCRCGQLEGALEKVNICWMPGRLRQVARRPNEGGLARSLYAPEEPGWPTLHIGVVICPLGFPSGWRQRRPPHRLVGLVTCILSVCMGCLSCKGGAYNSNISIGSRRAVRGQELLVNALARVKGQVRL
jgi:hypothetical protein